MGDLALATHQDGVDVVVGRQPIFDRDRAVIGYELLFRPLPERDVVAGELKTAEVLLGSLSLGLDQLVDGKLAFVNAERSLLLGRGAPMLPGERCVLEVLETVEPDEDVVERCRTLVALGYRLALDDFVFVPGIERLLELASIVKLDVLAYDDDGLAATIDRLEPYGALLLAEKVETPAQLERCQELGFHYFQGYVLSRPEIIVGRSLNPGRVARLQLVAELFDEEVDLVRVESIVMTDPALVHQLLELAGIGAEYGTRREVRSVHEAAVLIGSQRLRSWAGLLVLIERGGCDEEKVATALLRARMCELLARRDSAEAAAFAFTAAMISSFDLLLGVELGEVVGTLSIGAELRAAALGGETRTGRIVADVADYLFGLDPVGSRTGLGAAAFQAAWVEAVAWVHEIQGTLRTLAA